MFLTLWLTVWTSMIWAAIPEGGIALSPEILPSLINDLKPLFLDMIGQAVSQITVQELPQSVWIRPTTYAFTFSNVQLAAPTFELASTSISFEPSFMKFKGDGDGKASSYASGFINVQVYCSITGRMTVKKSNTSVMKAGAALQMRTQRTKINARIAFAHDAENKLIDPKFVDLSIKLGKMALTCTHERVVRCDFLRFGRNSEIISKIMDTFVEGHIVNQIKQFGPHIMQTIMKVTFFVPSLYPGKHSDALHMEFTQTPQIDRDKLKLFIALQSGPFPIEKTYSFGLKSPNTNWVPSGPTIAGPRLPKSKKGDDSDSRAGEDSDTSSKSNFMNPPTIAEPRILKSKKGGDSDSKPFEKSIESSFETPQTVAAPRIRPTKGDFGESNSKTSEDSKEGSRNANILLKFREKAKLDDTMLSDSDSDLTPRTMETWGPESVFRHQRSRSVPVPVDGKEVFAMQMASLFTADGLNLNPTLTPKMLQDMVPLVVEMAAQFLPQYVIDELPQTRLYFMIVFGNIQFQTPEFDMRRSVITMEDGHFRLRLYLNLAGTMQILRTNSAMIGTGGITFRGLDAFADIPLGLAHNPEKNLIYPVFEPGMRITIQRIELDCNFGFACRMIKAANYLAPGTFAGVIANHMTLQIKLHAKYLLETLLKVNIYVPSLFPQQPVEIFHLEFPSAPVILAQGTQFFVSLKSGLFEGTPELPKRYKKKETSKEVGDASSILGPGTHAPDSPSSQASRFSRADHFGTLSPDGTPPRKRKDEKE